MKNSSSISLEQFHQDLADIHQHLNAQQAYCHAFYDVLDSSDDQEKQHLIDDFLHQRGLPINDETRLAAIARLVTLRDESLIQQAKKLSWDQKAIWNLQEESYRWASRFHLQLHESLLDAINSQQLLTPFYRAIMQGIHTVGKAMTEWHLQWQRHIVFTINPELEATYGHASEAIRRFLESSDLLDRGHGGLIADRSYSVLMGEPGSYHRAAYVDAFPKAIAAIIQALQQFSNDLKQEEDALFNQKQAYLDYLKALMDAFSETDPDRLVTRWADVDRYWMSITSPLQPGHPLEFYEDHYRQAVAPEWDLRLQEPESKQEDIPSLILAMTAQITENIDNSRYDPIIRTFLASLSQIQLYISQPALYYGAEFNGLFSAQVVPNDEIISAEKGKKIFAFPRRVLSAQRAKPFMVLEREIYPESFLRQYREVLFGDPALWHRLYAISTIGHEYGHILWLDHDSESIMNRDGQFKNIEEFKATCGGLVGYFMQSDLALLRPLLIDHIKRSIGLIAWMETGEVLPYYCEGLMHLTGLFQSGILCFTDSRLNIDLETEALQRLVDWYLGTYRVLAEHYLEKQDAGIFLARYATKKQQHYLPTDPTARAFVEHYWARYQEIGQEIDRNDSPKNWLSAS